MKNSDHIRLCENCGEPLPTTRRRFCSDNCSHRHHSREYKRRVASGEKIDKMCVICGAVITTARTKFCSHKCHNRFYYKPKSSKLRKKTCVICGQPFMSKGFKKTCSKECYRENVRRNVRRLLKKKRLEEAKLVKAEVQPVTITRQCLRCDKPFESTGDWICPICTKINSHLCNGVDWHYFVSPTIGAAC